MASVLSPFLKRSVFASPSSCSWFLNFGREDYDGRAPCCDKSIKEGPWSPEEDSKLKQFIEQFGNRFGCLIDGSKSALFA
ncbi:hypothetical protein HPP92_026017 [Vanilla planifolia]|uniref:Myb-like domain-containing protein n=1 Tax=Vanilla planifolia TaxID=51239 RepID=A0A835U9L7_VANPL|nr:hypothetical protein HPP92_026017 [Vanilla planifolia]